MSILSERPFSCVSLASPAEHFHSPPYSSDCLPSSHAGTKVKANASADLKTRLTDAELMAEMYTLTLAGHETTSSTLTFLTYELARHPEYQARMRKEIQARRALVSTRGDGDFTVEDLDSLTLTMNAIKVHMFLYGS